MPFDFNSLDKLFEDPKFMMGVSLLGNAGNPNAMNEALGTVNQMQRNKIAREESDARRRQEATMNDYRRQQLDLQAAGQEDDRARAKLYERQVATLEEKQKLDAENARLFQQALPIALKRIGYNTPEAAGDAIQQMQQPQVPGAKASFDLADNFVLGQEGGLVEDDAGKGPTNKGVNQTANPDIDVRTASDPVLQSRRRKYWDAIQGDTLPPDAGMVAYDAAINQGQDYARNLLQRTGGNPTLMLQQRLQDYRELAKQPRFEKFLPTWERRIESLKTQMTGDTQPANAEQPLDAAQSAKLLGALMMGAQGKHAEALMEIGKIMEPKYETPGAINPRTGKALPDPKFDYQRQQDAINRQDMLDNRREQQRMEQGRLNVATAEEARKEREADQKMRESQGKFYGAYQNLNQSLAAMQKPIQRLLHHKGLVDITGRFASKIPAWLQSQDAADAKAELDHLRGQIFTGASAAFRRMNETGGSVGQQSDWEGQQFNAAWARLDQAQSTEAFRQGLKDLSKYTADMQVRTKAAYDYYHGKKKGQVPPESFQPVVKVGEKDGKRVVVFADGTMDTLD